MDLPAPTSSLGPGPAPTLADLRREIDRIDLAMHELLMERGRIIDRLIATKGKVGPPSGRIARPP
jgi:chorismate mutase